MSVGIDIGTFSGNDTIIWDCHEFIFSRVNIFLHSGIFGGGTITFRAGKKGLTEVIKVTSKINPATHSNMVAVSIGNYTIDIMCDEMQFVMTGATAPTLAVRAYPENIR